MFLRLNRKLFEEAGQAAGSAGDAGAQGGEGAGSGGETGVGEQGAGQGAQGSGEGGQGGSGAADAGGEVKPFFQSLPDDWRKQIAGDDEKLGKQLERHTDLMSVLKSGFEAQQKIRKGEMSNGLPENPTDEQMAAWREANGVPESAEGYELQLDEGLVLGDSDTRILEGVRAVAHEENISGAALSKLATAMLKGREAEAQAIAQQDGLDQQTCDRQLKEMWGGEVETNKNIVINHLSQLPESVRDSFMNGRLADGKAFFNSPEIMAFFADAARKINPAGTVVPNANNPVQAINDEIKALEAKMGEPGWHSDKKSQDRYMELITARDQMNKNS